MDQCFLTDTDQFDITVLERGIENCKSLKIKLCGLQLHNTLLNNYCFQENNSVTANKVGNSGKKPKLQTLETQGKKVKESIGNTKLTHK